MNTKNIKSLHHSLRGFVATQQPHIDCNQDKHKSRNQPGNGRSIAKKEIAEGLIIGVERNHFGAVRWATVTSEHVDYIKDAERADGA